MSGFSKNILDQKTEHRPYPKIKHQMQGPLLGSTGQAPGSTSSLSGGGGGSTNGSNGTGVAGVAGGMTYRSGLGGSMQSFLGEAGMYADSSHSPGGADSFKDGFDGSGKDFGDSVGGGSGDLTTGGITAKQELDCSAVVNNNHAASICKTEPSFDDENDSDGEDMDEEHEYPVEQDEMDMANLGGAAQGARGGSDSASELRGLGRIFGMGMHPVVAEAQARAEALVHGRGGKPGAGGTGNNAVDAAEKKRKRAVLSKEERAKQNRDRNREHARNTRLRKKAFVEELKKQVSLLLVTSRFAW